MYMFPWQFQGKSYWSTNGPYRSMLVPTSWNLPMFSWTLCAYINWISASPPLNIYENPFLLSLWFHFSLCSLYATTSPSSSSITFLAFSSLSLRVIYELNPLGFLYITLVTPSPFFPVRLHAPSIPHLWLPKFPLFHIVLLFFFHKNIVLYIPHWSSSKMLYIQCLSPWRHRYTVPNPFQAALGLFFCIVVPDSPMLI